MKAAISHFIILWIATFGCSVSFAVDLPPIPPRSLEQCLTQNRLRVSEFREIAQLAQSQGLRAYLFGGTATAFRNYVRLDYLRKQAGSPIQSVDWDYYLDNIYRPNQDLDIVVTGTNGRKETVAEMETLESRLFEKFPGLKWEVRGLRTKRLDKEPLLDNPEFTEQNSDSASSGLIELTVPPPDESIVVDLRDPKHGPSHYLDDGASGLIRFYSSERHLQTGRYLQGKNPLILGALRYLKNVSQYGLKTNPSDLEEVRRIIDQFEPASLDNDYVRYQVKTIAKKILANAMDLEESWNFIDQLGLRRKLLIFDDPKQVDSVAWEMNREPLRTIPYEGARALGDAPSNRVQKPLGRTAAQLRINTLSHSTSSYESFLSISSSPFGKLNAFVSISDQVGSGTDFGEGFYFTNDTKRGGWTQNFIITAKLDPDAVEGIDFVLSDDEGVVVLKRGNKLHLVPNHWAKDENFMIDSLVAHPSFSDPVALRMLQRLSSQIRSHVLFGTLVRRIAPTPNWPFIFKLKESDLFKSSYPSWLRTLSADPMGTLQLISEIATQIPWDDMIKMPQNRELVAMMKDMVSVLETSQPATVQKLIALLAATGDIHRENRDLKVEILGKLAHSVAHRKFGFETALKMRGSSETKMSGLATIERAAPFSVQDIRCGPLSAVQLDFFARQFSPRLLLRRAKDSV